MREFLQQVQVKTGTAAKSNLLLVNTNNLCLICLNLKECGMDCKEEGKLLCRILTRYFGANLLVPDLEQELTGRGTSDPSSSSKKNDMLSDYIRFPLCENCATVAEKLIHQFQQLELVQMKLQEYGKSLCDIMTYAGKVPNRVSRFYEKLSLFKEIPKGRAARIADSLRLEVLQKCSESQKNIRCSKETLPSVKIVLPKEPLQQNAFCFIDIPPPPFEPKVNYSLPEINPISLSEEDEEYLAFLGCAVSLWIVFLLALLDIDQLIHTITFKKTSKLNLLNLIYTQEKLKISESGYQSFCKEEIPSPIKNDQLNERKRKTNGDDADHKNFETKKLLISIKKPAMEDVQFIGEVKAIAVTSDESTDEVIEDDIIKEEYVSAYCRISKPKGAKRNKKKRSGRPLDLGEHAHGINFYTLITAEEAMYAVRAIQSPVPPPLKPKPEEKEMQQVKQTNIESNAQLQFEERKCDAPAFNEAETQSTEQNKILNPNIVFDRGPNGVVNIIAGRPIPIEIEFMDIADENVVVSQELTVMEGPVFKCHVCQWHFNSRAKAEKHRAVSHQLANYVECPSCFQMLQSYFHLELHRTAVPECRIDDSTKELEMRDIARPLFPFEKNIIGNIFCPVEDCYEVFDSVEKLNVHVKAHGRFICRSAGCNQIFGKGHELAVHEIYGHGHYSPNSFKCPRCDYLTEEGDSYITHFICQHLNINFNSPTFISLV